MRPWPACRGLRPGTDALADIRSAAVFPHHRILPVCAKMPHVLAGGRIHNEHAPVSVTVGDVHEVGLRIHGHIGRPIGFRSSVDAAVGVRGASFISSIVAQAALPKVLGCGTPPRLEDLPSGLSPSF